MNETEWFRIEDGRWAPPLDEWERPIGSGTSYVHLYAYRVAKETPCGVWLDTFAGRRFVLRDARKRWACPTKEEALESFRARKERQLKILRAQVRHVEECLVSAASVLDLNT